MSPEPPGPRAHAPGGSGDENVFVNSKTTATFSTIFFPRAASLLLSAALAKGSQLWEREILDPRALLSIAHDHGRIRKIELWCRE